MTCAAVPVAFSLPREPPPIVNNVRTSPPEERN